MLESQAVAWDALVTSVSLSVLAVLYFRYWRRQSIEVFRQNLFETRDRMFLWASATEGLEFSDPAYTRLRSAINGYIRFAEDANLLQVLLFILASRGDLVSNPALFFDGDWKQHLETVSAETARELQQFRRELDLAVFEFMVGPVVIHCLLLPLASLLSPRKKIAVEEFSSRKLRGVNTAAHALGS